ncbi:hypothetical protein NHX12_006575 [Muraenolepis orangiensis]|uniref:Cadherin domain-containing protein n=1 Tax=Muraenolepis orangiensis TaxID=630683 RepID=A0A9Q0DR97_9TELE|nr:hypothetical protein NHX12_006575 [Muraenolepis orangiensis]
MIWTVLLVSVLVASAFGKEPEQVPFFQGHVFENSALGSRVNGLSIPLNRLKSQGLCGGATARGDLAPAPHFKLLGDGRDKFRVVAHHQRGHVLLKTSVVLDREERAEYLLGLGLCCGRMSPGSAPEGDSSAVAQVAAIQVEVLDTNDHEPTFEDADVKVSLDDATALRTVVYTVTARDRDSGSNAEIKYFAVPKNGSFYVVPKTGDVLLVDSILGLASPVTFKVFARDHGWPPRTSRSVTVEMTPRQWPACPPSHCPPGKGAASRVAPRRSRSVLESDDPVLIHVSEDAGIGSVVINLNPVRFQSPAFELVDSDPETSPVSVSRESGDIVISRKLDRETNPLVEITVKVQDKRGA